jgi:hypothetical protein
MSEEGIFYSQAKGFHMMPLVPDLDWLPDEEGGQRQKRIGYKVYWDYGDHDLDHVICYRSTGKVPTLPEFEVEIGDVNYCEVVYVTNKADLLALRMDAVKAFHKQFEVAELLRLAERVFRMWHGHDVYGSCWECNPGLMKQRAERERAEREAKKP